MRRDRTETVTEVARRRLELMARELADLHPGADGDDPWSAEEQAPEACDEVEEVSRAVHPAGRHLRRQVAVEDRVGGWVEDRLPVPLRGRLHLGTRELVLVVLVAAVGLVLAAVAVLRSSAEEVAAPAVTAGDPLTTPAAGVSTGPVDPTGGAGAGVPATPSPTGTVVVDVAGRVRHPGVVTLAAGSRVVDALRRAGGALPHADLTSLNLAAVLTDGQQIVVGAPSRPAAAAAGPGPADGAASGPLVDLNAASQDQLEALPGVGPVTAQKILAWRTAHGAFSSLDELLEVDGIGPKTLAEIAPHLTL